MTNVAELIEVCTQFAVKHDFCMEADMPLVRNRLMNLFGITMNWTVPVNVPDSLLDTLEELVSYAVENNMLEMDTKAYRDQFDTRICGCMLMPQSQVQQIFAAKYAESPKKATDWFYRLCCDVNYIRTRDIAKNEKYTHSTPYGNMEITINLTKPEKDPKEIERQKALGKIDYPKCMLCLENVGYSGRAGYPSHETLRTIPLELNGNKWNFQYSPYVYYDEHCIVFDSNHVPMDMGEATFRNLFAFLRQFPHYFIGSNTQLPVVGGSILVHEHFQGGRYVLPMQNAESKLSLHVPGHSNVTACILHWPMAALRLSSPDADELAELATSIYNTWYFWTDEKCGIFACSDGAQHNTVTPITRINGKGEYEIDIVLRNNLTTEEYPLGVFHPHPDKHHIKKENIGLIEVMGLFILPGRLKNELAQVARAWVNGTELTGNAAIHAPWLEELRKSNPQPKDEANAALLLRNAMGDVCVNVLRDSGVYKEDDAGQAGLKRFVQACGFTIE